VLLLKFATELEDQAKVDQLPQLEGKKMIIMLSPKKQPVKAVAPSKSRSEDKQEEPKNSDAEE
ncbi:MAG: hypothetical protein RL662_1557, partial [Bacteroidota bacterium]|jgi:translation initiation factor IF-3